MKITICAFLLTVSLNVLAQVNNSSIIATDSLNDPRVDSLVKQRLIDLALQNPAVKGADAMIHSAEYQVKGAKLSWLNAVVLSGNVNEFVINNTQINGIAASTLYPKYNVGVNIPLGIFVRQDKNVAQEQVQFYNSQKEVKKRELVKEVLSRYETYREKKELFDLQKLITDGQYSNYQQRQKEFASGEVRDIKDVNKEYQLWLQERSSLITKERDLKVARLDVEEIIGTSLTEVIQGVLTSK